jgi:hypothetical protein
MSKALFAFAPPTSAEMFSFVKRSLLILFLNHGTFSKLEIY